MKLTERLGKEWIFFDGGMGTILQEHGLKAGELPETWNLSHPDEIIALNRSYFEAGCDVVNTNTFGANALKYPDNLQEIVQAAVSHAKTARQQAGREDAYIALDIGPTGKLLQPMGDLPFERAVELFGETIRIGAAAGAGAGAAAGAAGATRPVTMSFSLSCIRIGGMMGTKMARIRQRVERSEGIFFAAAILSRRWAVLYIQ